MGACKCGAMVANGSLCAACWAKIPEPPMNTQPNAGDEQGLPRLGDYEWGVLERAIPADVMDAARQHHAENGSSGKARIFATAIQELAEARQQLQEAVRERDIFKDDFETTSARLKNALRELACPECGCADEVDAQSQECGCDSPLCERTIEDGTLAESWLKLHAARDAALAEAGRLSGELATALRSRERLYIGLMAQEVITVGPALLGNICEAGQNELEHRRKLIAEVLEADKADFPPTETDE